mmetsp:Transcript_23260/g.41253  ORF Transcript_23260/g.41253 Transcript_23260/m.41253 type:complete len:283 (+) Transcript_23260:1979-2827(+)
MHAQEHVAIRTCAAFVAGEYFDFVFDHFAVVAECISRSAIGAHRKQGLRPTLLAVEPVVIRKRRRSACSGVGHRDRLQVPRRSRSIRRRQIHLETVHFADVGCGEEKGVRLAAFEIVRTGFQVLHAAVANCAKHQHIYIRVRSSTPNITRSHFYPIPTLGRTSCGSRSTNALQDFSPTALARGAFAALGTHPVVNGEEEAALQFGVEDFDLLEMPIRTRTRAVVANKNLGQCAYIRALDREVVDLAALEVVGGVVENRFSDGAGLTMDLDKHICVSTRATHV